MLSAFDALTYLVLAVFVFAYGYVAYTAIAISRALSSRVYRSQGLGLAVVTLLMVELAITSALDYAFFASNYVATGIVDAVQLLGIWFLFLIGFYYFIDTSIVAARPTDPLFRDTFHWSRVRLGFWVYDIGAALVFPVAAAVNSYSYASGGIPAFFQAGVPALIVVFSGAVVLPIATWRSRDKILKRQLSWFAVYMIWFVFFLVGGILIPNAPLVIELVIFLAGAYPLYRSATSLVPLYEFDKESGNSQLAVHPS
jgi:hypothetical protein